MPTWPFPHNWSSSYRMTLSFRTTVLASQSGVEQRIAERSEPRRAITTQVLRDARSAQTFDRFLWAAQADLFNHVDPTSGIVSLVRLDEEQTVDHPTSGVAVSSVALSVEPGTDDPIDDEPDALYSYGGRYVFPFPVNWSGGRGDALTLPRRTADFDRGRIAVTRPVAFGSRVGSALLLRVGRDETTALTAFFAAMRGRQGEFWCESLLDDLTVLETVSSTLVVDGADAADMIGDGVNVGVVLTLWNGNVYRRRILSAVMSGSTTLLQMDAEIPEDTVLLRRCSWMRVSRFASDDLTIEWTTSAVAQAQVQTQTLPYSLPDLPLDVDPLLDYYGSTFLTIFGDLLDYTVNVEAPLVDDVMNRSELAFQFGEPMGYIVNSAPQGYP